MEANIPTYQYNCDACGNPHDEFRSITKDHPSECPHCGEPWGARFRQDFRDVGSVAICYGNPTTFGQQAEANAKRVGKERLQMMAEEARSRTSGFTGKLPDGAKPSERVTATPWWRDGSIPGVPKLDAPLDVSKISDVKAYVEEGRK